MCVAVAECGETGASKSPSALVLLLIGSISTCFWLVEKKAQDVFGQIQQKVGVEKMQIAN